ncbi:MAG TPA: glycosyltransferase family A protein [Acetobacteraceae bacterium]|nr:glycosyltransferase family A protein [Acetobacteraceae bacterium]
MKSFIRTYADAGTRMQDTFDVAVVMPSLLRPQLRDALRSIFAQDIIGRIQVLIGIDTLESDDSLVESVCRERPSKCAVQILYPGYSTSRRHGGLGLAYDGGVLRCILSYIANSQFVAYLDDDNYWRPDHLRLLRGAISQADWAFSLRWFLHPVSRRPICVDEWESVGPGHGLFKEAFGGFVDPSCLMLNKITCEGVLPWWNRPMRGDQDGMSADRSVFAALYRSFKGAGTNVPTTFYQMNPADPVHAARVQLMGNAYDQAG